MKLDRAAAHVVLEKVVTDANAMGRPVCVAVTDDRGPLQPFTRMDGASIRSIELSEAKAYSAARLGVSTTAFHNRLAHDGMPASYFADPTLTDLPGGAVISSQSGVTLGGVGVSGLAPAEDQQLPDAAAAAHRMRIDNFIAAGTDMILLSAGDPIAIEPAIKKAEAAGIVVVAVDARAKGADVAVTTDNVQAGEISCQYLVDRMGPKGNVIIESGPSVFVVFDRVKGCKSVLAKYPGIEILSSGENGNGSRDVGLSVAQSLLTRFPHTDGLIAINDPEAIGAALAAKQTHRATFPITGIDGSPDMENALGM